LLIFAAAYHHAPWMYWIGVITAFMTAFYVFRALFLCFFGEYRGHHHPHESPFSMWGPLAVLAALSLVGGYINVPKFLESMFPLAGESGDEWLMYVSVAAGVGGIALAYLFYIVAPRIPDALANIRWLYTPIYNKYFVDEFYDATVIRPTVDGSRTLLWRGADVGMIDGAVNGIGKTARAAGGVLKLAQSGYIRSYAAWVVAGSILLLVFMGLSGGAR
jgi:NADH-quinone oxidoreductase subunit L